MGISQNHIIIAMVVVGILVLWPFLADTNFTPFINAAILQKVFTMIASPGHQTIHSKTANDTLTFIGINGVKIITNDTTNTVSWNFTNNTQAFTFSNVGAGAGVFKGLSGLNVQYRSLLGTAGNITATQNTNDITFNTGPNIPQLGTAEEFTGNAVTIDNLKLGGQANGNSQSFVSLNQVNATKFFQNGNQVIDTLNQGTGISITGSGNSRTIASTVIDTNTAQGLNLTPGVGISAGNNNATQIKFKGLTAGACLNLISNATSIEINDTCATTSNTNGQKLGPSQANVFLTKSGNNLQFKGLNTTSGLTTTNGSNVITIGATTPTHGTDVQLTNTIGYQSLSFNGNPSDGQVLTFQGSNLTAVWKNPNLKINMNCANAAYCITPELTGTVVSTYAEINGSSDSIISTNTCPEVLVNDAFSRNNGDVWLTHGSPNGQPTIFKQCDNSTSPLFKVFQNQKLDGEINVQWIVPNKYNQTWMVIGDPSLRAKRGFQVDIGEYGGFLLGEQGPNQNANWQAIMLNCNLPNTLAQVNIWNMQINWTSAVIVLNSTKGDSCNTNWIENNFFTNSQYGIKYINKNFTLPNVPVQGPQDNLFIGNAFEMNFNSKFKYSFYNASGTHNLYENNFEYDCKANKGCIGMTWSPNVSVPVVIGGTIDALNNVTNQIPNTGTFLTENHWKILSFSSLSMQYLAPGDLNQFGNFFTYQSNNNHTETLVTAQAAQTGSNAINASKDWNGTSKFNGATFLPSFVKSLAGNKFTFPLNSGTFCLTNETVACGVSGTNGIVPPALEVYIKSGTVYEVNGFTGATVNSGTNASAIIQDAINDAGSVSPTPSVYVKNSTYSITHGMSMKSGVQLIMDQGVILQVPSNYSSYVFKYFSPLSDTILQGGLITEASPQKRLWTGIEWDANDTGIYFNQVRDIHMSYPNIGIAQKRLTSNGWAQANVFDNIIMRDPVVGVDFTTAITCNGINGYNFNTYDNIIMQPILFHTSYGFKNINCDDQQFNHDVVEDLLSNQTSSTITNGATRTLILGGAMTNHNFVDNGSATTVRDVQESRFVGSGGNGWSGINIGNELGANPTHDIVGDMWLLNVAGIPHEIEYLGTDTVHQLVDLFGTQTLSSKTLQGVRFFGNTYTANITLGVNNLYVQANAVNNPIWVNLPNNTLSTLPNIVYIIKKVDSSSNKVTILPLGSQTIDGKPSYVLNNKNDAITIIADSGSGGIWRTITTYPSLITSLQNIGSGGFGPLKISGTILQSKNITCGVGMTCSANSTDIRINDTDSASGLTSTANAGKATGSVGVLATLSGTTVEGRNITGTSPISVTKTNDTDISISCSTCVTTALTTSQNIGKGTGSFGFLSTPTSSVVKSKNATAGSGISLSGNTTDITFTNSGVISASGTAGNVTVSGTNPLNINTAYNVLVTNGNNQTITKSLSFSPGTKWAPILLTTSTTPSSPRQGGFWIDTNGFKFNDNGNTTQTADTLGQTQTFTGTKTFTTGLLKVADLSDSNGNKALAVTATGSAVDYFTIVNAPTASPAKINITATGSDSNIDIRLTPKGTGAVRITDGADSSKGIQFSLSGTTTGKGIIFSVSATGGRTQTFQDVTDTFVYRGTTDTLTAKTLNGERQGFAYKTADYSPTSSDNVLIMGASGGVKHFTLPAISTSLISQQILTLVKNDTSANAVVIYPSGTNKIQGASSMNLTSQFDAVTIMANSGQTNWHILSTSTKSSNFTQPANQTAISSQAIVMYGGYATFTPRATGNVEINVRAQASDSTLSSGCRIDIRYGTSNLGGNGAAAAGTVLGNNIKLNVPVTGDTIEYSDKALLTTATVGTKYFFDLGVASLGGGTCTLNNPSWLIRDG